VIEVQRLKLAANERARYTCDPADTDKRKKAWCDLPASGELLEARLVAPGATEEKPKALDPFSLDDRAFALLPKRRKQRVLLVSDGNLYLEGALLLESNLQVTKLSPKRYSTAATRKADSVIFDGYFPAQPPRIHSLLFNPPQKGSPFQVEGRLSAPLITDQNKTHPVMRWVTLKDVNISQSARFARGPGVAVLAASFKDPIIVARVEEGVKSVGIGFDVRKSDLPMRVAFPLLVLNSIDWFAGDTADLITSNPTGQTWAVAMPGAQRSTNSGSPAKNRSSGYARISDPDGRLSRAPIHDGRVMVYGDRVGLYQITHGDHHVRLAANLADPVESKIQPARTLVLGGRKLEAPTGFGIALRREIWIYLLLAAIGLGLVEWLTYNRRITV
jgi:hypothetical protein